MLSRPVAMPVRYRPLPEREPAGWSGRYGLPEGEPARPFPRQATDEGEGDRSVPGRLDRDVDPAGDGVEERIPLEVGVVVMAVNHPSVETGWSIGRVVNREKPQPVRLDQELGDEPREGGIMVAPDQLEPSRKTRDSSPVGTGVRVGADVPEEDSTVIGLNRVPPVLYEDPVVLPGIA